MKALVSTIALLVLISGTAGGATIALIDEDFSGGSGALQASVSPVWADSDASASFEVYNSGGAGARGMSGNYDHDNNGGTPNIAIPGGIEVNDDAGNVLLTATLTLPGAFNPGSGLMTFWAGSRGGVGGQTIEILNVTDATTILPAFNPSTASSWAYNSVPVPVAASDLGDQIEVRFQGNGNGGQGLQLADLDFTVTTGSTPPPPPPGTLAHEATVEVSNNHSVFDVSVFPGKAGYDDGVDSGDFGDGTVEDYRFFNNSGSTFNGTGYANGGAGLVSTATATNSSGLNGGALNWADVWTTGDPDADPADFTTYTVARSQGITGTVDISGLESGQLYFIHGTFDNPSTVSLSMTGPGQLVQTASHTENPGSVNKAWVSEFAFGNAALYDTISWTYTNTDTDASRARFMGLVLDGTAPVAIPEPMTMLAVGMSIAGLGGYIRKRRRG